MPLEFKNYKKLPIFVIPNCFQLLPSVASSASSERSSAGKHGTVFLSERSDVLVVRLSSLSIFFQQFSVRRKRLFNKVAKEVRRQKVVGQRVCVPQTDVFPVLVFYNWNCYSRAHSNWTCPLYFLTMSAGSVSNLLLILKSLVYSWRCGPIGTLY